MNDCLIIGGGVIGLSLAYELAGHGLSVRVVERGELGREASWAGAGILPPANSETAVTGWEQLSGLSYDLHPHWARTLGEETGIDTGFRSCGGIHLALTAGEAAALKGDAAELQRRKIDVVQLRAAELAQAEPVLSHLVGRGKTDSSRVKAGFLLPGELQVRNPRHLKALQAACLLRGVDFRDWTTALGIEQRSGQIQQINTCCGPMRAKSYCICTGAWAAQLAADAGVRLRMEPVRGQILLLRCKKRPFERIINVGPRYLVPRDDGRVLVGSTEEEVGFEVRTTASGTSELLQFAIDLVPELADAELERSWAGLRPRTSDGVPYIGKIPWIENGFIVAGHFRSGITLSPGTAKIAGRLIRGLDPKIDIKPFRIDR